MNEILNSICLNDNAYFFKKQEKAEFSDKSIKTVFDNALQDKNRVILNQEINTLKTINGRSVKYSFCIYKYQSKPTFLKEAINDWYEVKFAYIFIIEYPKHIIVSKKNMSGIQDFVDNLIPLDYKVLKNVLLNDNTVIEKLSLDNLSLSNDVLRSKTVEANNLKNSFPILGAGNYVLNSMRIKNGNEKSLLALNTSRINKTGNKEAFFDFLTWTERNVKKIENTTIKQSYLSHFAEPCEYESMKDELVPKAIVLNFSKLFEAFENELIIDIKVKNSSDIILENFIESLQNINGVFEITPKNDTPFKYSFENDLANDFVVQLKKQSIEITSKTLRNINIEFEDETICLEKYINKNNCFRINFESTDLIYANRVLFKDSHLLGSIN